MKYRRKVRYRVINSLYAPDVHGRLVNNLYGIRESVITGIRLDTELWQVNNHVIQNRKVFHVT